MAELKLIALDAEDLGIVSAHLQDAVLRVGEMAYLPKERRFAAIANRFDWTSGIPAGKGGSAAEAQRRRAALRFERVIGARVQGISLNDPRAVLALLSITFNRTGGEDAPEGDVTLTFSGGAAIRLSVECIEAELKDLGAVWATKSTPEHPEDAG
ncbi:DUF2948 domain-containing protein [Hyphomicrobium methylovorum]|uniref:DUF2948 family protein n=1 Tax=Hyphomicrobium methylovorum TaxID=84 RepID=UPI0015E71126|nr:DUF2948 family protein [Hyphomicrobium methylovorum]MBA2126683.1 DUF2948 domain-containing protein [Hyphomicrobium methylovorum]